MRNSDAYLNLDLTFNSHLTGHSMASADGGTVLDALTRVCQRWRLPSSSDDSFGRMLGSGVEFRQSADLNVLVTMTCAITYLRIRIVKDWKTRCTDRVVFRLDKDFGHERTRLTLDGEISTECIEPVETCCEEAMGAGKPVDLVLRDVTAVDEAGRALLRRLAETGVRLCGNGVYTSYLVESASAEPATTEDDPQVRRNGVCQRREQIR